MICAYTTTVPYGYDVMISSSQSNWRMDIQSIGEALYKGDFVSKQDLGLAILDS